MIKISASVPCRTGLGKGKGNVHHTGAHLPLLGLEPLGEDPPMSVTHGQCDSGETRIRTHDVVIASSASLPLDH